MVPQNKFLRPWDFCEPPDELYAKELDNDPYNFDAYKDIDTFSEPGSASDSSVFVFADDFDLENFVQNFYGNIKENLHLNTDENDEK